MTIEKFVSIIQEFGGVLAGILVVVAIAFLLEVFTGGGARFIRRRSARATLRESVQLEIAYLERLLKRLKPQITFSRPGAATQSQLRSADEKVPGSLQEHFEDLKFLLDLDDIIATPIAQRSPRENLALSEANYVAAYVSYQYGDFRHAIQRLLRLLEFPESIALKIVSKSGLYFALGTSFLMLAQQNDTEPNLKKSIDALEDAVKFGEKEHEAQGGENNERLSFASYNLAWALDELGRITGETEYFARAIQVLERSLKLSPSMPLAQYNLACALMKIGKPLEALEALRKVPAGFLWEEMSKDPDLAPLREDAGLGREFEGLIAERLRGQKAPTAQ